jgi:hypothetical protein
LRGRLAAGPVGAEIHRVIDREVHRQLHHPVLAALIVLVERRVGA